MGSNSVAPATQTRLARSVLTKNLRVKPGERVIIEAWTHTLPWAAAFAREARRLGAQVLVPYEDESAYWQAIDAGAARTIGKPAAHEWAALAKTDVYIHMWGPGDRVRLNALPTATRDQLFAFNPDWYAAAAKAGVRGARLEIGRPYPTLARAYGASERGWTEQLVNATMVDPTALSRIGKPIARTLERGSRVRIRDDRGTDLTLGLRRRSARVDFGRLSPADLKQPFGSLITLPAGSVRVALDEGVADGTIVGNRTNFYDDAVATGGVLHFRQGKLTEATFERGGERFEREYKAGGMGRDRPGLLGIGLNPKLRNTPQVEDRELGSIMVSAGGNRFSGGKNPSPFFGWVVNVGATVEVDGKPLTFGR